MMFFEDLEENYTKVLMVSKRSVNNEKPLQNNPINLDSSKKSTLTTGILIAGLSGICFFNIGNLDVFASDFNAKAEALYYGKFLGIAKWVIIGKGGWDTLNKAIKEDFDGAKKSFMQYMLVFATLLLLPIALDQVEIFVKG